MLFARAKGLGAENASWNDPMMGTAVDRLEEKIAHLQQVTDDLSDVITAQSTEIARLTMRVEMLSMREAEREVEGGGTVQLADQKPPHW